MACLERNTSGFTLAHPGGEEPRRVVAYPLPMTSGIIGHYNQSYQ